MEKKLREDNRMLPIIESIERKYPGLFFHFIPTGSLPEGLGKSLQDTKSPLASDYDIMLVPCGITVGEEQKSEEYFIYLSRNQIKDKPRPSVRQTILNFQPQ